MKHTLADLERLVNAAEVAEPEDAPAAWAAAAALAEASELTLTADGNVKRSSHLYATVIALLLLWSPAVHAQDKACSNELYYVAHLGKQADISFSKGDCHLGLSQLLEGERQWGRISTLDSCSTANKEAALANIEANKRLFSLKRSSCPAYVQWTPAASTPEKTRRCDRDLSATIESHLQAMSYARDRDCVRAVPLFESTSLTLSELASRATCSAEAHQAAFSNMHRIHYDLSILRTRYCPVGADAAQPPAQAGRQQRH